VTNKPAEIRLLLIDDHALFREGLVRLLQAEPGLNVVGHCSTGVEAKRIIKSREIDVVLLDLDLGPERGADLLDEFRAMRFSGRVLLVTADVNDREVPNLIRKGIAGILMKHNSHALLVQGIRDAMKGKVWFEQGLLKRAMERIDTERSTPSPAELTRREKEVLSFVFEGLTNKEIGDRLQISESAVKACLQNLFSKTGVRTRSQLVRVALERYRDQL
jgi:two-component system nitrate/nitrite response regulator NarL